MDHFLLIINSKIDFLIKNLKVICIIIFLTSQGFANGFWPDQKSKTKKEQTSETVKILPEDIVKWPKITKYSAAVQFSNSRIDGFQISNNTKGTLVSETNMAFAFQYFNWIKPTYDFSVGINFESIKMLDEANSIPIDNSQVLALGVNVMGRYQYRDNLYLKGFLGMQDKIFYAPNLTLTGYELEKPMIPYLGAGVAVLISELFRIKFGIEPVAYYYFGSSAGTTTVDSGQGYEIKFFSIWPRGSNQIVADFFYNSRIQNSNLIRTQEQKIGFGIKYQFQ